MIVHRKRDEKEKVKKKISDRWIETIVITFSLNFCTLLNIFYNSMTTCRILSDNLRQVVGGIIGKYPPSLQRTSVSAVSILTKLIIIETAFSFNPFFSSSSETLTTCAADSLKFSASALWSPIRAVAIHQSDAHLFLIKRSVKPIMIIN